jgi:hypothetical protein
MANFLKYILLSILISYILNIILLRIDKENINEYDTKTLFILTIIPFLNVFFSLVMLLGAIWDNFDFRKLFFIKSDKN